MSANLDHMENVARLASEMIRLVELYESDSVPIGPSFSITLTGLQVTR
jgi:hypothetical protein